MAQSEVKASPGIFFPAFPCSGSGEPLPTPKLAWLCCCASSFLSQHHERKRGGVSWRGDGLEEETLVKTAIAVSNFLPAQDPSEASDLS